MQQRWPILLSNTSKIDYKWFNLFKIIFLTLIFILKFIIQLASVKYAAILCIVSPLGEASMEICSSAALAFSRLQEATWFAQVSNKWIKYKPLSSDFNSLIQGCVDPKLGECDIMDKNYAENEPSCNINIPCNTKQNKTKT